MRKRRQNEKRFGTYRDKAVLQISRVSRQLRRCRLGGWRPTWQKGQLVCLRIQVRPMISFVISKTAVTPWMAQESSLSANQTVYRRRQADWQPLRRNSTSAARRELAAFQATTERRPVAT